MPISKDLFLAILSMDSYNRGYGAGIKFTSNDSFGTAIGNATIAATRGQSDAQSVGFYALAYDTSAVNGFSAGEKTIAYRGTDQLVPGFTYGSDVWNSYGVGAGFPTGAQAAMAIQFYKTVAENGATLQTANVSLTGHWSDGGLAGLVGGLYGKYGNNFPNLSGL
jgi:hypothetical protein